MPQTIAFRSIGVTPRPLRLLYTYLYIFYIRACLCVCVVHIYTGGVHTACVCSCGILAPVAPNDACLPGLCSCPWAGPTRADSGL